MAKRGRTGDDQADTATADSSALPPDDDGSDAAYEGLARRYRPQDFMAVVGQKHVVQTLSRALDARQWAHAYLFVGGRGLGKTTMARIVAKGINCEEGPSSHPCGRCSTCRDIAASRDIDVLEIDAASHTGVDNVRDLIIQSVATAPARGRAKVFIIDEVHMLSAAAFNALLKTIEEPPPGIVFILATTDGHKVPATIRSRCQRFDFRPVTADELGERLKSIASQEKFAVDEDALALIAEHAEGGVRDALSALDLVRAYSAGNSLTKQDVESALGLIPSRHLADLAERLDLGDAAGAIELLGSLVAAGADTAELLRGLLGEYRKRLHAQLRGEGAASRGRLVRAIEALLSTVERARNSRFPRLEMESLFCRIAHLREEEVTLRDLWNRLQGIESSGAVPAVDGSAAHPQPGPRPAGETLRSATSPETKASQAPARSPASSKPSQAAPETPHPAQTPPPPSAAPGGASGGTPAKAPEPAAATSPGAEANAEVVEMLQRIFNAEVVDIARKS